MNSLLLLPFNEVLDITAVGVWRERGPLGGGIIHTISCVPARGSEADVGEGLKTVVVFQLTP
tara:strand:+ start:597 stop:782 length:186 start_codon:yes stop_codon:yes gene_type:complete